MPHKTTWEERGIYWEIYGVVTLQEITEINSELYGDPRFDSAKYQIWDASGAESLELELKDADEPAAIDAASSTYKVAHKCALIAKKLQIRRLIERYIETSLEAGSTWKFKLFDNINDARDWVNQ